MITHSETALTSFRSGLNCAQSVISAFMKDLNVDARTALSITCGFGGGMGRLQKTCGAVTGAFMVLSIHHCMADHDQEIQKDKAYAAIRAFHSAFLALHGTSDCSALIHYDLQTPEGQQKMRDDNIYEKVCARCIADAVTILDSLLSEGIPASSYRRPTV
jgi:C_GCAxxG_C_C family probable redox protein